MGGRSLAPPRIILALVASALLLVCAASGVARAALPAATEFAVGSTPMRTAERLAVAHWGVEPCNGDVTVAWAPLGASFNAISTWQAPPAGPYSVPAANRHCLTRLNSDMSFDWPQFCTTVIHEFGHLTGHPHVADPNNVMNPVYVKPAPECADPATAAPVSITAVFGPAPRRRHRHRGARAAHHRRHRHHRRVFVARTR